MKYFDQNLTQETLETYQGYSLQVFTSGRIKLSFHRSHKDRVEYYGECPKRFKEAYAKQSNRSRAYLPDHFNLVETVLVGCPHSLIHRLHMKADNNATADNAHIITDIEADTCHILLGTLHHRWELLPLVVQHLMSASGPRRGAAACFNEYMPSYEHDWMEAQFESQDYQKGYRSNCPKPFLLAPYGHKDDYDSKF
ncbi:hypothetical protein N9463_02485 [Planktomarina sp.]|nr:hypothetical protein [Planktomarina sp.]